MANSWKTAVSISGMDPMAESVSRSGGLFGVSATNHFPVEDTFGGKGGRPPILFAFYQTVINMVFIFDSPRPI